MSTIPPEPWGLWKMVYFTEKWDVGPGETACFPTKWMSEDSFSVRKAILLVTGHQERTKNE